MIKTNLYFAKNNSQTKNWGNWVWKHNKVPIKRGSEKSGFSDFREKRVRIFQVFFSLNGQKFKNDIEFSSQLY